MCKIVKLNDKNASVLRRKADKINFDDKEYIEKLKSVMRSALEKEKFGVAIAAPQVNESVSAFLIAGHSFAHQKQEEYDPAKHKDMFFFNPKIIKHSKKMVMSDEGCLSVPGKYSYKVPRYDKISVEYYDENGEKHIYNASGFISRVMQHEIDHLEGVLYIDKALEIIDVDENLQPIKK